MTVDQLADLAARVSAQGAPVMKHVQPGLPDKEIERLCQPLGLRLPVEARCWWGWHDGVRSDQVRLASEREFGPGFQFVPLAEAVSMYESRRQGAVDADPDNPDWLWHPSWFPLTAFGNVACDCAVDDGAPTPIRDVDVHHTAEPGEIVARSMGEMVGWWIDALDSGGWIYDESKTMWQHRYELLDAELERTGLV